MTECLFCKIVRREMPSKFVYEDEHAVAFDDIRPQAPVHSLVIPKRHLSSVDEMNAVDVSLMGHLVLACKQVAQSKGLADRGYRIVTNTGIDAGQTVFHLHFHVLGGRHLGWPPG